MSNTLYTYTPPGREQVQFFDEGDRYKPDDIRRNWDQFPELGSAKPKIDKSERIVDADVYRDGAWVATEGLTAHKTIDFIKATPGLG